MQITQPHLEVNVMPTLQGKLQLSIQRIDGTPYDGFDFEDCQIDAYQNTTRNPVRWKDKIDMSELIGQTVYLYFRVNGCVLYSFRFADTQGKEK